MEIEREVTTYHVDMQCDVCKTGLMTPDDFQQVLALWRANGNNGEPYYPHTCNNADCGNKATYKERYPLLRYKYKQ